MSSSSATTEAQMRLEIARLTASINQAKSSTSSHPGFYRTNSRTNAYVNPNFRPASNKYVRPTSTSTTTTTTPTPTPPTQPQPPKPLSTEVKDVVLNGVAFESSGRSLVRKDLPKPASSGPNSSRPPTSASHQYARKSGHLIPASRTYKPKPSRPRPGRPVNRNMTLTNNNRPYQNRRTKSRKYVDKPCPRFTTTGSCSRGLTCPYKHDPSKIAVCWNFLQGNCPNTEETCNLSHDPTPERTPLCLHFVNKGRCTRDNCPFPHVNVGARQGVCRDFAVLGYCEKGLDCDKQHVRECPDFAEKGTCSTKGCKLPHVIRANRNRKPVSKVAAEPPPPSTVTVASSLGTGNSDVARSVGTDVTSIEQQASDANFGDGYIPLTFNESESEEEDEDDDEEDSEEEEETDPTEDAVEHD